jgi:formylglycine-generating enzyme required for sulfatase activity
MLILAIMVLPFLLSSVIYSEVTAPLNPADYEDEVEKAIRLEQEREAQEKEAALTADERKARAQGIQEEIEAEGSAAEKAAELLRAGTAEKLKNLPSIKMISVNGGCFQMGDFAGIGDDDERPVHEVCVSDYYLSETEVTQKLWGVVMGTNPLPKYARSPKKPVTNVSWVRANVFIAELNRITGRFYRLPTEAEWEYAAREGGRDTVWSGTGDESRIGYYAWFEDNAEGKFHPVKSKRPNAFGIYDMTGNAWEWVDDKFGFEYYQTSPVDDPYGLEDSMWRSIRGGSIISSVYQLRTTFRYASESVLPKMMVGFRLAE